MAGELRQTTLVLFIENDSVLLAMKKRGFGIGRWNGVGGKPEPGEVIEDAAVRECHEEIGVTPTKLQQVGSLDFFYAANSEWNQQVVVFTCHQWQGEPVESEEMRPQWFNAQSIPYKEMWPDDAFWLPEVLSGKYVTARFNFDAQNELVDHSIKTD